MPKSGNTGGAGNLAAGSFRSDRNKPRGSPDRQPSGAELQWIADILVPSAEKSPERPIGAFEPMRPLYLRQRSREHPHRRAIELEQGAARSVELKRVEPCPGEPVHLGCRSGQGFLFHRPKEITEIDRLLAVSMGWRDDEIPSLGA